jgi:hypothetical protein
MRDNRKRQAKTVYLPVTFHAEADHVVAIAQIGESTLGIRFNSPEMILMFMSGIMEEAAKVWPDNEWVKEYLSND